MDVALTRPVQVTLPAVAGTSGSAYVVPISPSSSTVVTGQARLSTPGSSMESTGERADGSPSIQSCASDDSATVPSRPVAEFLFHLTRMLTDPSIRNLIEWTPQGSIRVHDPHALEADVLGKYFRHSKYSSFQRQLNYFGFRKVGSKGRMSPCSYINDDTTNDLSSLLSIKRKTANRARSRKAHAEKEATSTVAAAASASEANVASVSDSESCSVDGGELETDPDLKLIKEEDDGDEEDKENKGNEEKEDKPQARKRAREAVGPSTEPCDKKRRPSAAITSETNCSIPVPATSSSTVLKLEKDEVSPASTDAAPVLVYSEEFGAPGTVDFGFMSSASTSPASMETNTTAAAVVSPAVSLSSMLSPMPNFMSSPANDIGNGSWEHLLLPQTSCFTTATAANTTFAATCALEATFQQAQYVGHAAAMAQPHQQQPHALAQTSTPMHPSPSPHAKRPSPASELFTTKFNVPNPLAQLAPRPDMALAASTAADSSSRCAHQQQPTPNLTSGFSSYSPLPSTSSTNSAVTAAYATMTASAPRMAVTCMDVAEEDVSVEKLMSVFLPDSDGIFAYSSSSGSMGNGTQRHNSLGDYGDYAFTSLSPSSSLVDLAAIPTLAS